MTDIKPQPIPRADQDSNDPFANKIRLQFGPLRISKEGIIINDGTVDAIKLNSTGLHGYNSSSNELVRVDSIGFHGYLTAGTETIRISGTGIEGYGSTGNTFKFYNSQGGTLLGQMGYLTGSTAMYITSMGGADVLINSDDVLGLVADTGVAIRSGAAGGAGDTLIDSTTGTGDVYFKGNDSGVADSSGVLFYNHDTDAYAEKTAIMPTSKGYNALYCTESPEVWFMDFCYGKKVMRSIFQFWKRDWIIKPDKMFVEVTEAPYRIIPTGQDNLVQVWGKRKGQADKRFESKTKTEFEENNKFWGEPQRRAQERQK